MSRPRLLLAAAPLLVLVTAAAMAAPAGPSAVVPSPTVRDANGDNRLERLGPDPRIVRQNLAHPQRGRAARRSQLIVFGQLSDFQIVDEESPVRGEFTDKFGAPFQDFYRTNGGTTTQVVEAMVRRMRSAHSQINGRGPQLVMTTGDNVDSTQLNETRWMVDLLDGRKLIDPNSGVPGSCRLADDGHLYDGARGGDEYYEPDRSGPGIDGPGYSPDGAENLARTQLSNSVRDFPGLLEAQNRPFRSTGLALPWYGIFGNHDSLLTGNFQRSGALARAAKGCVKVTEISDEALAQAAPLAAGGFTQEEEGRAGRILITDVLEAALDPAGHPDRTEIVPRDARRLPLKKRRYMLEHFRTAGAPDGHGFTRANLRSGEGNYAIRPRPGLVFLVLDSVSDTGGSRGNMGHRQFRWIHRQLRGADRRHELVLAFAHHSLRTMNQLVPSGFPGGDQQGDKSSRVHHGLGPADSVTPCRTRRPGAAPRRNETLRCLFLRHRSVVAYIAGHEHDNRITPFRRRGGGFWEIVTASHIDWPQQSRLIELFDNRDGTLSLFGSMIEHAGAPDPGTAPLRTQGRRTRREVMRIASISRELACNDPNSNSGAGGPCASGARRSVSEGKARDRNVELLVRNPFSPAAVRPPNGLG
jgi:metallophosphoesterase (TIGR03767 family)